MSSTPLLTLVARCRALCRPRSQSSDSDLLARFVQQRDTAAFEELLERYAPLVWGVCRRSAPTESDAEDAFQATFLALVRHASRLDDRQPLGGWLHTVAVRIARKTMTRLRRQAPQATVREPATSGDIAEEVGSRELLRMVDEEIERLPAALGQPLILCCLQGKTRDEAAEILGCSVAAIKSRLERGRDLLRRRLQRRGVQLPAAFFVLGLTSARIRASLWARTMQTILYSPTPSLVALADAGTTTMTAGTYKLLAAVVLLATTVGMAGFSLRMEAPPLSPAAPAMATAEPAKPLSPQVRTDRHGDPLPKGALARLGTVRWRHGFFVAALAFSPDGTKLAAVGAGRDITLWDAATGKEFHQFPNKVDQPIDLAFSPDGKTFVTSARKGILTLWSVDTGKQVSQFQGSRGGSRVAFAPDGKTLAAANYDDTVRMWDVATGKEQRRLNCGQKGLYSLAFSPDRNLLATAGVDGAIRLWDPRTGEARRRLTGHTKEAYRVVFAPDGKLLASSSEDNTFRLWDAATGRQVWKREEKVFGYRGLAFSPDGALLASGHLDGTIALWDVASRTEKRRWQTGLMRIFTLAFSPDGKTLASASSLESTIHLWDVSTGRERHPGDGHRGPIRSLRFSPDGAQLVSIAQDQQLLHWDLATNLPRGRFGWKGEPLDVSALSPDGQILAVAASSNQEVRVWDVRTGKPGRVLGKHEPKKRIWGIAFSPDGRLVASGGEDRVIHIWDIHDGKEVRQIKGLPDSPQSLRFTPDSKALACGMLTYSNASAQPTLRLWDVASGEEPCSFNSHSPFTGALDFSPDGKTLVSGHGSHRDPAGLMVRVWDTATGKELCRHIGHREQIAAVAFSPDGKLVASGSGDFGNTDTSVRVWEAATGRLIRHYEGHHSGVGSLAFSPDGLMVASGGSDSTILLWDITGRAGGTPALRSAGVPPAKRQMTTHQLEACWTDLANEDAAKAYDAVWQLVTANEQAVPFLRKKLPPTPRPDAKAVARWIADLDSDEFAVRQKANDELSKLGDVVVPALRDALQGKPSLETRRRLQQLLDQARDWTPERLRVHRAIQALEHIGTPAARKVLHALAEGAPQSHRTEEATAALQRLGHSPSPR